MDPVGAHGTAVMLLRQMELNQRSSGWSKKSGTPQPQPILLDGEEQAYEDAVERQERAQADVAARLGLQI